MSEDSKLNKSLSKGESVADKLAKMTPEEKRAFLGSQISAGRQPQLKAIINKLSESYRASREFVWAHSEPGHQSSVQKLEQLGYTITPGVAPVSAKDAKSDHTLVLMEISKEIKELLDEIKRDNYRKSTHPKEFAADGTPRFGNNANIESMFDK